MLQHFQQLQLPDGRNLDYCVNGPQDGFPLVFIHGTPGAGIPVPNLVNACAKKGIKVIGFSRAGYGGSTRNKGRQVVDSVADIKSLLDHLGVEKCLVGGWSGGGMLYVSRGLRGNDADPSRPLHPCLCSSII